MGDNPEVAKHNCGDILMQGSVKTEPCRQTSRCLDIG